MEKRLKEPYLQVQANSDAKDIEKVEVHEKTVDLSKPDVLNASVKKKGTSKVLKKEQVEYEIKSVGVKVAEEISRVDNLVNAENANHELNISSKNKKAGKASKVAKKEQADKTKATEKVGLRERTSEAVERLQAEPANKSVNPDITSQNRKPESSPKSFRRAQVAQQAYTTLAQVSYLDDLPQSTMDNLVSQDTSTRRHQVQSKIVDEYAGNITVTTAVGGGFAGVILCPQLF